MNVIITGTSRGIGLELAKLFAQNNAKVLALSRSPFPLKDYDKNLIKPLSFNIADTTDIAKVKAFIKENWKEVNIVIHNAGTLLNKPFSKTTLQDFKAVYDVNVFGVAMLTQAVLPYMNNNSHVVTISSMGGIQGSVKFPGLAAYSSSKGAVITLTELLAEEYKDNGPKFNALALGAVQTEMLAEAFPGFKAPVTAQEMAAYIYNFAITGYKYFNGKVLQVSNTTP